MRVSITKSIRGLTLGAGVLIGAVAWALAPAAAGQPEKTTITEAQVRAAQQAWGAGLVHIGNEYRAGRNYQAAANQFIDTLYDYNQGPVFFKPTQAFGARTFRPTRAGALSYFIGGNSAFPEDQPGFALKDHWQTVTFENNAAPNGIQIHGEIAITMGKVHLRRDNRTTLTVDKTLVFRRRGSGLRLCVHHSSLPFRTGK